MGNQSNRINTRLIYKIEIAQVVARRITKPQRRFESHWLLFFIHFFFIYIKGVTGHNFPIMMYMQCLIIMRHFIWVFTVCQGIRLGVSNIYGYADFSAKRGDLYSLSFTMHDIPFVLNGLKYW